MASATDPGAEATLGVPCVAALYTWYLMARALPLLLLEALGELVGISELEYARVLPFAAGILCFVPIFVTPDTSESVANQSYEIFCV